MFSALAIICQFHWVKKEVDCNSLNTIPWNNFCDFDSTFCKRRHPVTSGTFTPSEIAIGTHFWKYLKGHTSMHEMTLEPPQYFYLLIEKPYASYFQVQSPYYQMAQCNQKTTISVSSRWQLKSENPKKEKSQH